jgi:L-rhamnose mutarotase
MTIQALKMQLKPGFEAEYKRRHAQIWPELTALLRETGISDYSIFLDPQTLTLFGVLKLADKNTKSALPQSPVMRKWWSYMADLMETNADQSPKEVKLEQVFYMP